jgi:hypothetical protein
LRWAGIEGGSTDRREPGREDRCREPVGDAKLQADGRARGSAADTLTP